MRDCDLFCKVIDNYGDIGVCWRLARQMVREHRIAVRLWVDDLACFQHLAPAIDQTLAEQQLEGVCVRHWDASVALATPADVVIEAFGCDLPEPYLEAMAARSPKPAWINLEYLSAEAWVEGCHSLPSPHPRLPLTRYFFFPGVTLRTGGLLREAPLLAELDEFQANPAAQQAFWQTHGGIAPAAGALRISLFCYENPALPELLDAWANGPTEVFCAVPEGRILPQVRAWAGDRLRHGQLQLSILPFMPQTDYDRLLAACDLNFVRGEDSFVRAQWAGHPFVWHIYQQAEEAHLPKLEAFLGHYTQNLAPTAGQALRAFWMAWQNATGVSKSWPELALALPVLQAHAGFWRTKQVAYGDLTSKLLIFCKNLLECPAL